MPAWHGSHRPTPQVTQEGPLTLLPGRRGGRADLIALTKRASDKPNLEGYRAHVPVFQGCWPWWLRQQRAICSSCSEQELRSFTTESHSHKDREPAVLGHLGDRCTRWRPSLSLQSCQASGENNPISNKGTAASDIRTSLNAAWVDDLPEILFRKMDFKAEA